MNYCSFYIKVPTDKKYYKTYYYDVVFERDGCQRVEGRGHGAQRGRAHARQKKAGQSGN